jgi:hypothetical protein
LNPELQAQKRAFIPKAKTSTPFATLLKLM